LYALTAQAEANAALLDKTCQWKGKARAWKLVSRMSPLDVLLSKEQALKRKHNEHKTLCSAILFVLLSSLTIPLLFFVNIYILNRIR
jgi:hypothetical protein